MNRPLALMFPLVGGKRRMKGIVCVVIGVGALINAAIGVVGITPFLFLPGLLIGVPFLAVGIDALRPSVLMVREIDILIAWSPRANKQWLLHGISHAQATAERVRLTYEANPTLPVDLTLEACDFTRANWWPIVSAILNRARRMNPAMTFSLSEDLASFPALTAADLAPFRYPAQGVNA